MARSPFAIWISGPVVLGEVAKDFVWLRKAYPPFAIRLDRLGLEPCFKGEFYEVDGQVRLVGHFTLGSYEKAFMTVWFGFLLVWIGIAMRFLLAGDSRTWWFPFAGAGTFAGSVALVWFSKWLSRHDAPWLSAIIQDVLSQNEGARSS